MKTALHLAAEKGHRNVVKVLVERGANRRKRDSVIIILVKCFLLFFYSCRWINFHFIMDLSI